MKDSLKRKYLIGSAVALALIAWSGADAWVRHTKTRGWTRIAAMQFVQDHGGVAYSIRYKLFVVVDGKMVLALSSISPHSPSVPEPVLYCPSSDYFEATMHGEKFDRHGAYALGPAPRGMDRFAVMTYGGLVYAKPARAMPGPARDAVPPLPRKGAFCRDMEDPTRPGFALAS